MNLYNYPKDVLVKIIVEGFNPSRLSLKDCDKYISLLSVRKNKLIETRDQKCAQICNNDFKNFTKAWNFHINYDFLCFTCGSSTYTIEMSDNKISYNGIKLKCVNDEWSKYNNYKLSDYDRAIIHIYNHRKELIDIINSI